MGVLLSFSTVLFVILCVILIIIILLQSDKSAGMGILGGSSQSTFGSSTADVITKISAVMIAIFMLGSLGLAIMESSQSTSLEDKIMKTDNVDSSQMIKDKKPVDVKDTLSKEKVDDKVKNDNKDKEKK